MPLYVYIEQVATTTGVGIDNFTIKPMMGKGTNKFSSKITLSRLLC